MTTSKANQRSPVTEWVRGGSNRRYGLTAINLPFAQFATGATVALIIGLLLVFVMSWQPDWTPFFAVAALFPFMALIIGDLRKLLLAVALIEASVPLDIALYTDWTANSLGAIGGLYLSVTTICIAALYSLWLVELLARVRLEHRPWLHASFPALVYLAGYVLSIPIASALNLALFELFLFVQSFLLFLYVIKTVKSRQDLQFVLMVLLMSLAFQGAVMIGLRLVGQSIYVARIFARIDAGGRVGGTVGSPNNAAGYLTLLLAPALSVMMTSLDRWHKLLAVVAFGLGSTGLLLTASRGGWLGSALSITLLCLAALQRGWLSPKLALTILVAVALLSLLFGSAVLERLTGDDLGAAASRGPLAQVALRIIGDHPIFGVGANNYTTQLERYYTVEYAEAYVYTVHNKYLLVWAETGLIGLVTFLGFLFAHIRRAWQTWMRRDRLLSPLALGFAAAVVGQMVHMFFDVFHGRPQLQMLWLVAGLITAMRYMDSSTD